MRVDRGSRVRLQTASSVVGLLVLFVAGIAACKDADPMAPAVPALATPTAIATAVDAPLSAGSGTPGPTPSPSPVPTATPIPASDYLIDTANGSAARVDIAGPDGVGARLGGGGYVRGGTAVWVRDGVGLALIDLNGNVLEKVPDLSGIQDADDGRARVVAWNAVGGVPAQIVLESSSGTRSVLAPRPASAFQPSAYVLSPNGEHYFYLERRNLDATLKVVNVATGLEQSVVYPRAPLGTDFRLLIESIAPQWSPSGRFISFQELDTSQRGALVVWNVVGGTMRRFEEPCPTTATSGCSRPWPFWAPGRDRLLVPYSWNADGGLLVGIYEAASDVVLTPFVAAHSRRLEWASAGTASEAIDSKHTALYDVVSGLKVGEWTHNARGGGYESQGEPDSFAVVAGVPIYTLVTTSRGWPTYYSRVEPSTCRGAEAFHPGLRNGYSCVSSDGVVWSAWSPNGTQLAVTYGASPTEKDANPMLSVRVFDIVEGELHEVFSQELGASAHLVPRPFWAPDDRHLVIRLESTQI